MRRDDRAVTKLSEIRAILESCQVCRLAMQDEVGLYIVPMNFGFALEGDGHLTLYFHSAPEGRKIAALAAAPQVAFELDGGHELVEGAAPCAYSFNYCSITGTGRAVFCTALKEKIAGLQAIMAHQAGRDFPFTEAMVQNVAVFRVDVDAYTAKARQE